jgi:glycerophosphoryl diester phosphodiesterase
VSASVQRTDDTMDEPPWVARARPRGRALVFAHRGGAGLRPENTLAAFDHAAELGVDGFELDVRLSKDGEVVVVHDPDLDRTTDASGIVSARTADELARVDAGFKFGAGQSFPYRGRGFGIPRLADVLARHPSTTLIIELKGHDVELARAAVDEVRRAGAFERVCFAGFSGDLLRTARQLDRRVCTSAARGEIRWALYRSYVSWPLGNPGYRALQVPELSGGTRIVSPRFIRAAHRAARLVQVWTVNEPADMRRLLTWGVDALISDRPDVALEIAGALRSSLEPSSSTTGAPVTIPSR